MKEKLLVRVSIGQVTEGGPWEFVKNSVLGDEPRDRDVIRRVVIEWERLYELKKRRRYEEHRCPQKISSSHLALRANVGVVATRFTLHSPS